MNGVGYQVLPIGRHAPGAARVHRARSPWRTWYWVKPRAGQPQNHSPCPRAPARTAPRSAVGHHAHGAGRRGRRPLPPILPRRGPARDVPRREGRNSLRPGQEGILPVNTERAETRRHGGG